MEFIKILNELLFENNITKREVSRKADIPYTTICGWCNGRLPDYNAIVKLSNFFNVSSDYLLGNENRQEESIQHYTQDEQQLIEAYRAMNPEKKKALFDMLDIDTAQQKKFNKTD